jgi:hypothetical protein
MKVHGGASSKLTALLRVVTEIPYLAEEEAPFKKT